MYIQREIDDSHYFTINEYSLHDERCDTVDVSFFTLIGHSQMPNAIPAVPDNDFDSDPIHSIADPENPLQGPRSRYWMVVIWNLFPENTPEEHQCPTISA